MSSYLFEEITLEQAEKLVKRGLNCSGIREMRLLKGGLFNTTYFLRCVDGVSVILRLGPVNKERLLDFEQHLMESEQEIYRIIAQAGIPTSRVLYYDNSQELIGREYQLVEYIDAEAMENKELPQEERAAVEKDAGRYLKKLHNITSESYGTFYQVMHGKGFPDWYSFVSDYTNGILRRGREWNIFSGEDCEKVLGILRENEGLLRGVTKASLLHTDLWTGNIMIQENRFCAIIDADRALWGDPDYEFAPGWMSSDAFFEGYGLQQEVFQKPDRLRKKYIYQMLYALMETYIWNVEYDNPELSQGSRNRLNEKIAVLETESR